MASRDQAAATRCPYCGEPNSLHDYASPTTCVLRSKPTSEGGGYVQTRVNEPTAATASRRVWKFSLPEPTVTGRAFVDMPAEVMPLSVGLQGDEMVVWALVDPDRTPEQGYMATGPRRFIVTNTGADIPGFPGGARFLGTIMASTGVVWHVWDGDAETTA